MATCSRYVNSYTKATLNLSSCTNRPHAPPLTSVPIHPPLKTPSTTFSHRRNTQASHDVFPPTLKHVLNISLIPGTPLDAGLTPHGKANWVELTSGDVTTPDGTKVASILTGGGDYCTRHVSELFLEVDLRVLAKADGEDGALFKFESKGFDKLIPPVMGVLDGQGPPEPPLRGTEVPKALYGAEVISVNTSSKEYWWLNFALLVAKVALVLGEKGVDRVDYAVYQVVV